MTTVGRVLSSTLTLEHLYFQYHSEGEFAEVQGVIGWVVMQTDRQHRKGGEARGCRMKEMREKGRGATLKKIL